jgi:hypothetical protein
MTMARIGLGTLPRIAASADLTVANDGNVADTGFPFPRPFAFCVSRR